MSEITQNSQQPGAVKYVQSHCEGIQSRQYLRHGIGYVLKGKKYIYYGDIRYEVNRGDMFYLKIGNHYTEEMPDNNKQYEEIMFFYTPETLSDILSTLSVSYQLQITNNHSCDNCHKKSHVIYPAWSTVKNFFLVVNQYLREGLFIDDVTAEKMKATELIYLIISNPDCCIKSKVLDNIDLTVENFERTIQKHIFEDIPVEELARRCNKSLTSFKKEFKQYFHEPPHKWLIKQRLMHSRLLLTSTNKSVSEIGRECNFPNTSHYIKLFKQEYGVTPAVYRNRNRNAPRMEQEKQEPVKHSTPKTFEPV